MTEERRGTDTRPTEFLTPVYWTEEKKTPGFPLKHRQQWQHSQELETPRVPWQDTASGGPRQGEEEEPGFWRWKDTRSKSTGMQALAESFAHGQTLFSKRYDADRTDGEKPQPPGLEQQV